MAESVAEGGIDVGLKIVSGAIASVADREIVQPPPPAENPQAEKGSTIEGVGNSGKEWTEEQREVFEKELKLKETWGKWIKEICPVIQQRAKCYGLEESVVAEIEGNLEKSFREELQTVTIPKKMKKLRRESFKAIDNLVGEVNRPELKNLLGQLSKKDILDLLNRKLEGKITSEEKKILDIFSDVNSGGAAGRCDPFSGEIEIYLLNSSNLQGCMAMLMHEFTHKGLSNLEPKEVGKRKISMMLREPPKEKKSKIFWGVLLAVDESLANRVQKYYTPTRGEPPYDKYKNKIDPEIFKEFYTCIDAAAAGKSIEQFDNFAAHTYVFFANKWKKDLSPEDIQKAIASTIEEINKFKEG